MSSIKRSPPIPHSDGSGGGQSPVAGSSRSRSVCLAILSVLHREGRGISADFRAIRSDPPDWIGGIFLRSALPSKARTVATDNPAYLARVSCTNRCGWTLSRRRSRPFSSARPKVDCNLQQAPGSLATLTFSQVTFVLCFLTFAHDFERPSGLCVRCG